jgi:cytochrome b
MRNKLVYDLPTRIFHWVFVVLFVIAILIGKNVDDKDTLFSYHMLAGLTLTFVVLLRILWGFVGTKYARFSSLILSPKEAISYFVGILKGEKRQWIGHNPASSWSALLMIASGLGLGITGWLMANGQRKAYEDIHEIIANTFLVVAILHVVGVIRQALHHRDGLMLTMFDGKKVAEGGESLSDPKRGAGLIFAILVIAFGAYLLINYDTQTQFLDFFGRAVDLGHPRRFR